MPFNPSIFREYDVRGVADRDLDSNTVRALGVAIANRVEPGSTVVVGRDCRLHSDRLFDALTTGLRGRVNVVDIGVCPTPLLYFAEHLLRPAAAIMITGSHNPSEDNGFKILVDHHSFFADNLVALRSSVVDLLAQPQPVKAIGSLQSTEVEDKYLATAKSFLRLGSKRCKVVVDAGNGAGGPLAVQLYRELGFEVVPLFCDMDGRFPNHHPDPTVPANLALLIAKVKESGADLGIALDGDADRVGAVDASGRILWGDQLMILYGKAVLAEVPNAHFVGEVKCSQLMYDGLRAAGASVEMWKVGHSLIKTRMKETNAALAGEMSGHMFFSHRWLGFDDAIYAGARLLELLSKSEQSLSQMAAQLPTSSITPEIRVQCADDKKFAVVAAVKQTLQHNPNVLETIAIDGVRVRFSDGWGLVRASNTQPALVMRCEASDDAALVRIVATLDHAIEQAKLALP